MPSSTSTSDSNRFSWRETARSPLVRQILLGLIGVGVIELLLVACVGYCLFQSASAAEREFDLLQASSRLVNVLKAGRQLWAQATSVRHHRLATEYEAYRHDYSRVIAEVDQVSSALRKAHVDTDIVAEARNSLNELDAQTETIYRRRMLGDQSDVDYHKWKIPSMTSLEQSIKVVGKVHELILQPRHAVHFERAVWLIVLISLFVNALIALFGYRIIRSRITKPIVDLAVKCDRILQGEVIEASANRAMNEISGLERAFRLMSVDLAENAKRRSNFQNLFRDVLMNGLQSIDESLSKALRYINPDEQNLIGRNVQRCKGSLSPLIVMLESLSESLSSDREDDLRLVCKDVEIRSLVDQCVVAVESLAKEKEIVFSQHVGELKADFDEHLIRRVIINLLSNAIKFSPHGGEIEISVANGSDRWQLSIRDHGKGIPDEARNRLFTRFGTLHKASEQKRDGTGLGLVICKQIVEAHGGTIWCDSVEGSGSTFSMSLPKQARSADASPENKTIESAQEGAGLGSKGTRQRRIAHYYWVLLLGLILSQTGVVVYLQHDLGEIGEQTSTFAVQREGLIATQNMLSKLIQDRYNVLDACRSGDIPGAINIIERLDPSIEQIRSTVQTNDATADSILQQMSESQSDLIHTAETLPAHLETLPKPKIAALFLPARNICDDLENDCFALMKIQQDRIENTFALAARLRTRIAVIISFAVLADLVIFSLAVRHTLILIARTKQLSEKALAFGDGVQPERTEREANDELSLLEQRFCESAARLQSIEERRQTLMAVVNHDLRTPVTSMMLTLEMTMQSLPGTASPELSRTLQDTAKGLESVFGKINDFLLLERLSHSAYQPQFEQLALDEIFDGVAGQMSLRGLIDRSRLVSDAEDFDLDWIVLGDRRLLEAMFFHLLRNALAYSEESSPVTIKWSRADDGRIRVSVRNQGQRISSKLLPQMFDRYRSLDGAAITGIGLPMLAYVTKAHNGDVQLASNTLDSCTFEVLLPSALSAALV